MSEGILPEMLGNEFTEAAAVSDYLRHITKSLGIKYLGVYSNTDYITAEGISSPDDYESRHYEHFNQLRATAFTQQDSKTGKLIFWVNHSIRNSRDEILGSCQVGFSIDDLTESINEEITGEGNLFVVDQVGTVKSPVISNEGQPKLKPIWTEILMKSLEFQSSNPTF